MIKIVRHGVSLKGEPMMHRGSRFPGLSIRLPGNRTLWWSR